MGDDVGNVNISFLNFDKELGISFDGEFVIFWKLDIYFIEIVIVVFCFYY